MDGAVFGTHEGANAALEELKVLFDYLEALDSLKVSRYRVHTLISLHFGRWVTLF